MVSEETFVSVKYIYIYIYIYQDYIKTIQGFCKDYNGTSGAWRNRGPGVSGAEPGGDRGDQGPAVEGLGRSLWVQNLRVNEGLITS